jgi:uncharacterized membrane protein
MEDDNDSDGQWLSILVGGSWIMYQITFEIVVGVVWLVVVCRQLDAITKGAGHVMRGACCLKWWLALVRVMIGGVVVVVVDGGWSDDQ